MYIIKQVPEDFKVEEIPAINPAKKGGYTYFILTKRNYTTEAAIQTIAKRFRTRRKFFGYAGNKDKKALTTQYCSVKGRLSNLSLDDIEIKIVGKGTEPVSLGDLKGNKFDIVVRNIDKLPSKVNPIVNYFDTQRFGIKGNNHVIGKLIVKRDFEGAVELIENNNVTEYIKEHPNDFVGALRAMPKKNLMMYVHAFQSDIWNRCAEEYTGKNDIDLNAEIPIVGFGTELFGGVGDLVKKHLEKEGFELNDFVIRAIPELSSEGSSRKVWAKVDELKIGTLEDDELNLGKKKVEVSFSMTKGSYATLVIKEMFRK